MSFIFLAVISRSNFLAYIRAGSLVVDGFIKTPYVLESNQEPGHIRDNWSVF